jgi:hypothetical protein
MRDFDSPSEQSRARRERERPRDRGYREPGERPYARDRERRTEFRGPEFVEHAGYASRYPSRPPQRDVADDRDERFEGFGEERPQDHPGHGRTDRFGSEAAGYGRERMHERSVEEMHDTADPRRMMEHERRRRSHEGIGEYGRGESADREQPRREDEPHPRHEGRPEHPPHTYEEQRHAPKGHPSYGGARSFGGYGGFGSGGYPERRTGEEGRWQNDDDGRGVAFPRQGVGTAHPGSSRWVEGGRWDEETESITDDYSRHARPYGSGRPSERIDEWARGSAERPSGGYAGRGPRSYRRSDERIREDVCERLTRDDDVDAADVDVEVRGGEVVLEGTVDTHEMRRRAEQIARECSGVREVRNELQVTER